MGDSAVDNAVKCTIGSKPVIHITFGEVQGITDTYDIDAQARVELSNGDATQVMHLELCSQCLAQGLEPRSFSEKWPCTNYTIPVAENPATALDDANQNGSKKPRKSISSGSKGDILTTPKTKQAKTLQDNLRVRLQVLKKKTNEASDISSPRDSPRSDDSAPK